MTLGGFVFLTEVSDSCGSTKTVICSSEPIISLSVGPDCSNRLCFPCLVTVTRAG